MSEELFLYFMQSESTVSIKDFFLSKKELIAGRKEGCDLHLSQYFDKEKIMRLSRHHFMIYQKFSQLFIKDMNSNFGTEVDGKTISPNVDVVLHVGQIIRLSKDDDFQIIVTDRIVDNSLVIDIKHKSIKSEGDIFLYFFDKDTIINISYDLINKEAIIAGRTKKCDLVLAQHFNKGEIRRLSRKHFMIYQRFSQLFIEDLGSRHGTELDGKKLLPGVGIVLHPGQTIRLAQDDDFLIRVIDDNTIDGTATMIEEPQSQTTPPKEESGLEFDEALDLFSVNGQPIHRLSQMQYDLLKYLYKNAERSCSFHDLRQNVWYGMAKRDTIRTAVHSLRKKLDKISPGAGGERYIKNLHGYGYRLTLK